jgi:hypothetical protein
MYDRTYVTVKKLLVEFHRLKYQHVDEQEIYKKTREILERLKELEIILKHKIEE